MFPSAKPLHAPLRLALTKAFPLPDGVTVLFNHLDIHV
jgi:hypothetical protein